MLPAVSAAAAAAAAAAARQWLLGCPSVRRMQTDKRGLARGLFTVRGLFRS